MYKIGLTGGICTGKSYILGILKELNCFTIKADEIAKKIIFSNRPAIVEQIVKVFGQEVADARSGINKEIFSRMLFADPEKRNFINSFIHPLVAEERKSIFNDIKGAKIYDFVIYESALLVESGTYKDFDRIIVVYTSQEEQIHRLMARDGIEREEAENRLKSQFPLGEKLKVAHYTIDTSGTFENSRRITLETFHLLKREFNL